MGNKIFQFKLSDNIHNDIDTIYDAINYTEALIDGLIEEEIAQNNHNEKRMSIFLEMLSIQDYIKKASTSAQKLRWNEEKNKYGPLTRI